MTLGEKLKAARKAKNIARAKVALAVGSSDSHIFDIENDNTVPGYSLLKKLCELYEVDVDDIAPEFLLHIPVYLEDGAFPPRKAHASDAGFDLYTPIPVYVPARGSAFVDTKVHLLIPRGYCGVLISKSGLNVKHDLTSEGLIDALYTGSVGVKLYNNGDTDYYFAAGEKVSQIAILPCPQVELDYTDKPFEQTERGDNGFGSSGK